MKSRTACKSIIALIIASLFIFSVGCASGDKKASISNQTENSKPVVEDNKKEEEKTLEKEEIKEKEVEKSVEKAEAKPATKPAAKTSQPKPATPVATTTTSKTGRPDIPEKYAFSYLKSVEDEIVKLCNEERAKGGLKPLSMNETLRQSARYKSNEMLQYGYFDHNSPITGYKSWELAKTFGYSYTIFGENIWYSKGYSQAQIEAKLIVSAWMSSEGHRKNIMNGSFGRIGVGVVYSTVNKKAEATQQFSN